MSHSHGLALHAISRGREVGVDLEYICPEVATDDIADRVFSVCEAEELRLLTAEQRPEAFFNCWARKEAYIKARGEGLSHPLQHFSVSLSTGAPISLLSSADPCEPSRWTILELRPGHGYAAALAVSGSDLIVRQWQWS